MEFAAVETLSAVGSCMLPAVTIAVEVAIEISIATKVIITIEAMLAANGSCCIIIITSAFKEYWGEPELIILCYICSSASHLCTWLVCTTLHPQTTHRHCSKFSVAPMSI